jgi:integrase
MRFETQAAEYIIWIQTRRRNPVRPATARIYQSYLDAHILPFFSSWRLDEIDNGAVKGFIAVLNKHDLSPSTINQVFNVVKAVIASAVDSDGNERYPRKWNHDFLDLPVVNKGDVDAPIVTPEQVNAAILSTSGQFQAMLVLLAASGLRIGECLALTTYPAGIGESFWSPISATIYVKSTLVSGKVAPQPKTDAGNREIDLHPEINAFLIAANLPSTGFLFQNREGNAVRYNTILEQLNDIGIDEGFHAFRRFRATHLESQNVPRSLLAFWLGHAGSTITDRYIKIGSDFDTRREWASRAGYGFTLPKESDDNR